MLAGERTGDRAPQQRQGRHAVPRCGTVVVHGQVNGNIKARTAVELHRSAKVHGNIETPSILVEKGVLLQGEVKMTHDDQGALANPYSAPSSVELQ